MAGSPWLKALIRKKFKTPEAKQTWWTKLSRVRHRKCRVLFDEQHGRCAYCDKWCWIPPLHDPDQKCPPGFTNRDRATLDHIQPQMIGGTDAMWNLIMACEKCNSLRGSQDAMVFFIQTRQPELWDHIHRERFYALHGFYPEDRQYEPNYDIILRQAKLARSQERQATLAFNLAVAWTVVPMLRNAFLSAWSEVEQDMAGVA